MSVTDGGAFLLGLSSGWWNAEKDLAHVVEWTIPLRSLVSHLLGQPFVELDAHLSRLLGHPLPYCCEPKNWREIQFSILRDIFPRLAPREWFNLN